MRRVSYLLLLGFIMNVIFPLSAQDQPYRVIGYFPSWSIYADPPYLVTDIPADQLTQINYAFAGISDAGEIALLDPWADTQVPYPGSDQPGNFHQLQLLKAAHPSLQTLISIGGWSASGKFSDVALTPESREKFARSVVDFIQRYGFDGVDIDWEFPTGGGADGNVERPEDVDNFVLLLQALRDQLDAGHYLLTIAAGSGKSAYQPLDWARIAPLLDWINVMTYDFVGAWSAVTGFNAPLYNSTPNPPEAGSVDQTLSDLLALGIPADKLVMGVPFYGRAFAGAAPENHGLHQPFAGVPEGTDGAVVYRDLAANQIATYPRYWDAAAQVPWLYDPATQTMISYDDPESLALKAQYVRDHDLGGIMIWALNQDTDASALLTAVDAALTG